MSQRLKASLAEWGLLFLSLVGAIWLATQSRAAPQLILLTLLSVIALNFSLPLSRGAVSPILPIIAVTSLLTMGYLPALLILVAGFLLAEFSRSVWLPLWQDTSLAEISRLERFARAMLHVLILGAAGVVYRFAGGNTPILGLVGGRGLQQVILLSATYAALFVVVFALFWRYWRPSWSANLSAIATLAAVGVLSQPFALFGAITFSNLGLPAFVIYGVGIGAFAIIIWVSWQRHFILNEQLEQFAALNAISLSLRETLDLETVLDRTYLQVTRLVTADRFAISLQDAGGNWYEYPHDRPGDRSANAEAGTLDGFTRWVLENERVLELNPGNLHFAQVHDILMPSPQPAHWLGVPLATAGKIMGAMVLQRYDPEQPFGRWTRELLLAIAGQASAALENARLHGETVRLYNLTDEALTQRLKQLQAVLSSTYEGVLMVDTRGAVILVNPQASSLLEMTADDLHGRRLPPAVAPRLGFTSGELDRLVETLASGSLPASRRDVYLLRLDGQEKSSDQRRYIERNESPVENDQGQLLGWLFVLRDVTEEQEREEWRTNVTRMIVHDLRNPVTTLVSDLDLIEHALASDDTARIRRHARRARDGTGDMLDMIDSLMDVTRLEAGQLVVDAEAMRLPALVNQVVDRLRSIAEQKQIVLTCTAPTELPPVWADAEILRRVYVNLIDNALKFTPAGGRVHIELEAHDGDEVHETGVRCTITDSGPGIPEQYREQIFDRFTRVNVGGGQVRGTGLGLTFCKLALEAHGGRIWVDSSADGGTSFIFTVPGIPIFA